MIGRMAAALSLILIAATLPAPASTRSGVPTAAAATAATAKPPAAHQTHDARAIGAGRFGIAQVYVPEGKPRSPAKTGRTYNVRSRISTSARSSVSALVDSAS